MAEYPLLIFPEPSRSERAKRQGFGPKFQLPDSKMQAQRLAPQFHQLQEAMEHRRVSLQDNPMGIQPEQVLVLETVGSIENFINAVRRIEGLEWLGEFEQGDIPPEFGFENPNQPDSTLRGQLILAMTNQVALRQLQTLFEGWQQEPATKFPYGLGKLRDAFRHLRNIRPWGSEDRIRETGIMEDWQFRLQNDESTAPFEADLWFRGRSERRNQSEAYVRQVVQSLGGEILSQCVIPEIRYHAILGTIPRAGIQQMVSQPQFINEIELLRCDDVMHIRPVGQCAITIPEDGLTLGTPETTHLQDIPTREPLVALLDGMPLTGHQLIADRLIVDDPDDYESEYLAHERVHGTAMSSLICLGDANESGQAVDRKLYVRPIMKPMRGFDGRFSEGIPPDVLPVDLVYRAVRRLFEGESGEPPIAPSVRVVHLSVGDLARPLNSAMSPWARLLDWLSNYYDVLFVVSAGNCTQDLELNIPRADLGSLSVGQIEHSVIQTVANDTRNRSVLSPAETLNGLTVGAIHADASTHPWTHLIDPYGHPGFPSVISRHGPGFRRSIKPDFFLPGGRQLLSEKLGNAHLHSILKVVPSTSPPGQLVATPGAQAQLDRTLHSRGTSNAAALASRATHFVYDAICQLREESVPLLAQEYDAVLLKALLVHGASWDSACPDYAEPLEGRVHSSMFKDYLGRFLGYGEVHWNRVLNCTDQRVTALGVGALLDGNADEFAFPLPPSLSSIREHRRLTMTLAWLTPVSSSSQNYRIAQLWVNPLEKNILATNRQYADYRATQRGTLQHEVLHGHSAMPFQDGDSIGIKVHCKADAGHIHQPIKYCVAVTLEVAEETSIPIYEEVRDRLAIRPRVQNVASV